MSTYNLQIRATDSGVPELVSFALVQVQVNDVNDNPPLFSQHNYSAFVHVSIIGITQHYNKLCHTYHVMLNNITGGQKTWMDCLPTFCD